MFVQKVVRLWLRGRNRCGRLLPVWLATFSVVGYFRCSRVLPVWSATSGVIGYFRCGWLLPVWLATSGVVGYFRCGRLLPVWSATSGVVGYCIKCVLAASLWSHACCPCCGAGGPVELALTVPVDPTACTYCALTPCEWYNLDLYVFCRNFPSDFSPFNFSVIVLFSRDFIYIFLMAGYM